MNEEIMRGAGFGEYVDRYKKGNCPWCNTAIHPNKDFRDALSVKEYKISGLCQQCQDDTFGACDE